MLDKLRKITNKIVSAVGSRNFFWVVIALFVLQALWIAISFRYPMVYDEIFHVPVIQLFSHQLSPFIINQPENYDIYGNLSGGGASLYHYLLSFPFRFIQLFTKELMLQVISLRAINIILFAVGIFIFEKIFKLINIKRHYVNVGLFIFVMLPIVPFMAAHVNYDNMLFVITAWYLLVALRLLRSKSSNWYDYALLIVIGCFASLVKFTFLPLFAASIIYLAVMMFRYHGRDIAQQIKSSFINSRKIVKLCVLSIMTLAIAMFSAVYLQNIIRYGSATPSCEITMSLGRCMKSEVILRNIESEKTKYQRPISQLPVFTLNWVDAMMRGVGYKATNTIIISQEPSTQPLPVIFSIIFFGTIIAIGALLYYWRTFMKDTSWRFLITMSAVIVLIVFINNYVIYFKYHALYAIQARYILNVLPIMVVSGVVLFSYLVQKRSIITKVILLLIIMLLFTQGGGVITYILRSEDSWYWHSNKVVNVNHEAKKILQPLVKEW